MVLPDCNLLPECMLPLYIFEQRYRNMLRDVLKGPRMFCVGTLLPDAEGESPKAIYPHSTVGIVRACVGQEDGNSRVALLGLYRVKLSRFENKRPYLTAKVTPIISKHETSQEALLIEQIHALLRESLAGKHITQSFYDQLISIEKAETLADILGFHLLSDPHKRQILLAQASVPARLEYVKARIEYLLEGSV